MIVLGVDPGTATTGYGVIDKTGHKFSCLDVGVIETPAGMNLEERLEIIFEGLKKIIKKHHPDKIGVELLFFSSNVKTAMSVGQARGVVLLAAAKNQLPLFEFTPPQVKQAVCGYGAADKKQVQKMVAAILGLKEIPKPDDAADALAVAIAAANSYRILSKS